MQFLKTQPKTNTSYNNTNHCPNCAGYLTKIGQLQSQLSELSNAFAQAVAQIKNSQKLKTKAAELDEKLIEQCVREKTDAQAELQKISLQSAQYTAKIRTESEAKIAQLNQQITKLQQQNALFEQKIMEQNQKSTIQQQTFAQLKTQYQQKLNSINAAAQKQQIALNQKIKELEQVNITLSERMQMMNKQANAQRHQLEKIHLQQVEQLKKEFEQDNLAITEQMQKMGQQADTQKRHIEQNHLQQTEQLKKQYEQRIAQYQTQQQELLKTKAELAQANEQIAVKARMAARAQELNERLQEQCNMAKLGADAAVQESTKAFHFQYNKLKNEATDKLKVAVEHNNKIKTAAQQALQKATQKIQILEQTINNLKSTAALIEPNLRSDQAYIFKP